MNELIKITQQPIDGVEVNTVNARELWEYLESSRQFANWIQDRIEKYQFINGVDFVTFNKIVNRATLCEYHISIDMAKELAMVENNEKGRQIRKYFIECEKKLKSPMKALTRLEMAKMLVEAEERYLALELENAKLLPKAEFYDEVTGSTDTIDISECAKVLNIKGIGRNQLFEILREKKVLQSDDTHWNQPYQKYCDQGYFRLIEQKYNKPNGTKCINLKTVVFQTGLDFIRKIVKDYSAE